MRDYPNGVRPPVLAGLKIKPRYIERNFKRGRDKRVEFAKPGVYRIVDHTTDGYGKNVFNWFNRVVSGGQGSSAHYCVMFDGTVEQYVDERDTAWGASHDWWNDVSINIEHADEKNPNDSVRTAELYEASALLKADICYRWELDPFNNDLFTKHKTIKPGRACPAGLDTERIKKRTREIYLEIVKYYTMNDELKQTLEERDALKIKLAEKESETAALLKVAYDKGIADAKAAALLLQQQYNVEITEKDKVVIEKVRSNVISESLILVNKFFELIYKPIRPAAYLLAGFTLFALVSAATGFDWQGWQAANPNAFTMLLATILGGGATNQVLYSLNQLGQALREKAYTEAISQ